MKSKDNFKDTLAAYVEAGSYRIDNLYFSRQEKAIIESVFGFPQGIFVYSFFYFIAFLNLDFLKSYIISSILSAFAVPISLNFRGMWIVLVGSIFYAGNFSIITELGLVLYLYFHGMQKYAILFVSFPLIVGNFLIPSFYLWNILYSRIPIAGSSKKIRGINPRYIIGKKLFGVSFPFEEKLINNKDSTW